MTSEIPTERELYLVLYNISKKNNVKDLIATATAFGFQTILVGTAHSKVSSIDENQIIRFDSLEATKLYLNDRGIPLVGIEILDNAHNVITRPFVNKSIAFMPGNEGTGLNLPQRDVCNYFVYIPQYGNGKRRKFCFLKISVYCMHYQVQLV